MNIKQLIAIMRRRTGVLPAACIAAAAVVFASIGTARAEQEITPEDIYYFACVQCHQAGLNAAPKFGDSKAWAARIAQGRDTVYGYAINGKGAMPPKGGRLSLTDEQVKLAVDYMVDAAGGWPETK